MSKVAPDTRNKIDTQKNLSPNRKTKKLIKKQQKEAAPKVEEPLKVPATKKNKAKAFRDRFGYSLTMHKNMKKNDLDPQEFSDSLNAYRAICKKRRQAAKKVKKDKHMKALAGRKAKASKGKK